MSCFQPFANLTPCVFSRGEKHVKQIRGLHFNPLATNKNHTFNWASIVLRKTSWSSLRSVGGVRISQKLREDGRQDDLNAGQINSINGLSDLSMSNEMQANTVAIETIAADIIPAGDDVFVDNGEYDLDCPTGGLNSIAEAIEDIRQGKVSILPVESLVVLAALALFESNFSWLIL